MVLFAINNSSELYTSILSERKIRKRSSKKGKGFKSTMYVRPSRKPLCLRFNPKKIMTPKPSETTDGSLSEIMCVPVRR